MTARLVLLGTGTCQLDSDRAASAALIELPNSTIVFDFGRGVANRLVELGLRQNDVANIVLSHFHPDHLSDLVPFIHAGLHSPTDSRTRDLTVFGPGGVDEVVDSLLSVVSFPVAEIAPFRVVAQEVRNSLVIGDWSGEYESLPPAGNHGMRFMHGGRSYALTGDSHFHQKEIEFLRGVDLAVVDSGHLDDLEIVELAVRSDPGVLVCSHIYRDLDETFLNHQARSRGFSGKILIGRDRMAFAL